jgi:ankyrin repeat protein
LLAALSETTGAAPLVDAASDKQRATALALLAEGVDANVRSPDNTTALHWAAYFVRCAGRARAGGSPGRT